MDDWHAFLEGDYEAALRVARTPVNDEDTCTLEGRGTARLYVGQPREALSDFLLTRRLLGNHSVLEVGVCLWWLGQREAACEDWRDEIVGTRSGSICYGSSSCEVDTPALLWWAAAHPDLRHWKQMAEEELRRLRRTKRCRISPWPGTIGPFLLGLVSEETLLQAAVAQPRVEKNRRRHRCQAHFYIGARRLAAGDHQGYLEQLTLALAEGFNPHEPEYHLARFEVKAAAS
jgi:hypothetical protein